MKYTLEKVLAFRALKETIWKSIQNAKINQEDGTLEFEADLKGNKGKHKRQLKSLLKQAITEEYITLLATEMMAESYLCIPVKGGWVVVNPKGETYQLTENDCTCNDKTLLSYDGPCKHLLFRDFFNFYRSKVNKYKTEHNLS
jgi:hypothetical protein